MRERPVSRRNLTMGPVLRAVLLCADATIDDDGDYDLHGVFRQLVIEEFPATVAFKVFVMWTGLERRPYRTEVEVKGPSVSRVQAGGFDLPTLDEGLYDQSAVIPVELTMDRAGDLYVEVRLDNQTVGSFFVPVTSRVGVRR
jgi:hypothetical protein